MRPLVADLTIDKKTGICTTIELGTRIAGIVIGYMLFVYNVVGVKMQFNVKYVQLEIKTFDRVLEFEMWRCGMSQTLS